MGQTEAEINLKKHAVDFADAVTVFSDDSRSPFKTIPTTKNGSSV